MKKHLLTILGFAVFSSSIAISAEKSRPMDEMHGDCSNYKTKLQEELSAWENPSLAIPATAKEPLPLMRKVSLALSESQKVKLPQKPEKSFAGKGPSYAGIFPLRFSKTGQVRIAAGGKVWFDLVDKSTNKLVESAEFEMQTKCSKIYKVVTFPVREGLDYLIQVSSSSAPNADFIFSLTQ